MKFLCLCYFNEAEFGALPAQKKDEIMKECFAQCIPFRATGKVAEEEMVESTTNAKTIRPKNGTQIVTDGPFVDTKEQIGAFLVIEAENIDEAVAVAKLHPGSLLGEEYGFGIEVRPF